MMDADADWMAPKNGDFEFVEIPAINRKRAEKGNLLKSYLLSKIKKIFILILRKNSE